MGNRQKRKSGSQPELPILGAVLAVFSAKRYSVG